MSTTNVLLRSEIDSKVQLLLREAEEKVGDMLSHQLSFLYGENLIQAEPIDTLRVISEMVSDDSRDQTLKNLLINTVVTSESLWAGSGLISLLTLLEACKVFSKSRILNNRIEYDNQPLTTEVCTHSRRSSSKDILSSIKQLTSSQYETEVAKSVLLMGGSTTVNISEETGLRTVISSRSGYKIKVTCSDLFWSASSASIISLYDAKSICIDGIVESVSEIHNIMDQSFETGQSVVIFARGFNDDVINTLAVNHSKGMLNVIPVTVPYDVTGVNQLVDIAICSKSDVVSALKGELISTIEWEDLNSVDKILINKNAITLHNPVAKSSVQRQVKKLQNKLSQTYRDNNTSQADLTPEQVAGLEDSMKEQRKILQERIFSLMSGGVNITLGREHGSSMGIRRDRISTILKVYGQASKFGLTDIRKCSLKKEDPIASKVMRKLEDVGITHVSPPALLCAFKVGVANAKMIQKIGAWLTVNER